MTAPLAFEEWSKGKYLPNIAAAREIWNACTEVAVSMMEGVAIQHTFDTPCERTHEDRLCIEMIAEAIRRLKTGES